MDKLLIIDDEKSVLNALKFTFEDQFEVLTANSMFEVNEMLLNHQPQIALIDLRFGKISGLKVLMKIKTMYPETIIIVMTAFGTIETSIKAIKMGAYDYVEKPIEVNRLREIINKAIRHDDQKKKFPMAPLTESNVYKLSEFHSMAIHSRKMKDILDIVDRISKLNVNVLIQGESGTGKELIVRAIYQKSDRCHHELCVVNCGAIPDSLIESELFGHVKGAFTGAVDNKKGVFERAHKGILFLDEIGEMSLASQVKLLRVLQEGEIQPVGSEKSIKVDVRVIAATNRNLEEEVEKGRFRSDLYYRLNVLTIQVPPLRERREDIPYLIEHFIEKANDLYGTQVSGISKGGMETLMSYDYKGNVRELENIIFRAVIMANDIIEEIALPDLSSTIKAYEDDVIQIKVGTKLAEVEQETITRTLDAVNGNKAKAARLLGISERNIHYKTQNKE
ncbi:sigma-54-dependent transcriptional regulator [Fusibacter ferrireducens]|uniref:Stage 0 sporulation protein A homolog n=1 Tax=Fusibacter ferrireducens TaxID=2785058 RepID=A0ABR9ZYI8_9FIRM|nr:sigma-54 dependent transcriptional regulator [Fusibacter ferrireducens]MBF4694950.1 sigma-54-dependent Fis family transcriptional regulator [Fusibacter ferrireducens]